MRVRAHARDRDSHQKKGKKSKIFFPLVFCVRACMYVFAHWCDVGRDAYAISVACIEYTARLPLNCAALFLLDILLLFVQVGSALFYGISSVAIMTCNKVVLTTYGFPSAKTLALSQVVLTMIVIQLVSKEACWAPDETRQDETREKGRRGGGGGGKEEGRGRGRPVIVITFAYCNNNKRCCCTFSLNPSLQARLFGIISYPAVPGGQKAIFQKVFPLPL